MLHHLREICPCSHPIQSPSPSGRFEYFVHIFNNFRVTVIKPEGIIVVQPPLFATNCVGTKLMLHHLSTRQLTRAQNASLSNIDGFIVPMNIRTSEAIFIDVYVSRHRVTQTPVQRANFSPRKDCNMEQNLLPFWVLFDVFLIVCAYSLCLRTLDRKLTVLLGSFHPYLDMESAVI